MQVMKSIHDMQKKMKKRQKKNKTDLPKKKGATNTNLNGSDKPPKCFAHT